MKPTMLAAIASIFLFACSGHAVEVPGDDDGTATDETKTTTAAPAPTAHAAEMPAAPTTAAKPSEPAPSAPPAPSPSGPGCDSPNVAVFCSNGACACGAGPKAGEPCGDAQSCRQSCAYCN